MANYPTSLDTLSNPTGGEVQGSSTPTHSSHHGTANDILEALEAKVGIGGSTPTNNTVLRGTGAGISTYGQVQSGMIGDGQVVQGKLATDAVLTANIVDAQVTTAKLAAGAATGFASASDSAAASIASASGIGTIPGMSVTLVTTGGPVLLFGSLTVYVDAATATAIIYYQVDGGTNVTAAQLTLDHAASNLPGTFIVPLVGLSGTVAVPVSHTFLMRWQTTASTLRRNQTSSLTAVELKR